MMKSIQLFLVDSFVHAHLTNASVPLDNVRYSLTNV